MVVQGFSGSSHQGLLYLWIPNRLDNLLQGVNIQAIWVVGAERYALPIMSDNLRYLGLR